MQPCTLGCGSHTDLESLPAELVAEASAGFKALGDPHRIAIVDLLLRAQEPVCVVDIERQVPLAQSTISYHLKFMVDANLLEREKRGRWMYYTVKSERLERLQALLHHFDALAATRTG